MSYKLLEKQREFLEINHNQQLDVALYQGGYGSGKTFAGSLLGILLCLRNPNIRGLVGALTTPLVIDTTLVSYFEHLDKMGFIEGRDYFYKKGAEKIIFANNSEIMFRHLEEPNKLKSLNLGFVEIEEMSDIPEDTFKMLLARLRQSGVSRYRLFGHTNPEQNKGWIYKTFIENPRENYRLIISPTTDNTYLPEHFVEELRSAYDPEYFRINVMGEFGDYSKGLVAKGFSRSKHVRELNYYNNIPLHLTCDFNVDPMCWLVAYKDANKVYFIDELCIENTHTQEAMQEFLSRYRNHRTKIIINGDASGDYRSSSGEFTNYAIIKRELERWGLKAEINIRDFNPSIVKRVASFNSKLLNCDGDVGIYIDPKCEKLIYNLENLKYKAGTSIIDVPSIRQLKNDRNSKFLGHMFDAASYLVEFYHPVK